MKINLRESLGRLDLETDNIYDLRNHYDSSELSDLTKNRLAEALNKNESAEKINRILNENFAINVFSRDSEEYEKLEKVADYLTNYSPNNIYYRVEKTYFDFGQDWMWTTIIAYDKKGNSWQAIYPKIQEDILLADSDEELEEVAKNILRESRLDKGFTESLKEELDLSEVEEIKELPFDNKRVNNLRGIFSTKALVDALNKTGLDKLKIRTSRLKNVSQGDIKDAWMDLKRKGWFVSITRDDSLKGFNEVYVFEKIINESLTEASYGGAYDIEDDMYFTKEELVEFADEFIEKFSDWSEHKCDLEDLYMDSPKHLVVDVYDQDDGVTHRAEIDIDMRKIRTPKSIYKYGDSLLKQWKDSYLEYHEYDESLNEEVEEQLYKIVCKNGPSEWPFESALSYEDAEEIVDYYGGRWIDEKGFEWSMEIEEDDESTERVNPFKESLNESVDISDYEELHYPLRDGDKYYQLYRKIENGKGVWAAAELDKYGSEVVGEPFKITYEQARGFEPIEDSSIRKLSRDLGKKLLPKRENLNESVSIYDTLRKTLLDVADFYITMEYPMPDGYTFWKTWEDYKEDIEWNLNLDSEGFELIDVTLEILNKDIKNIEAVPGLKEEDPEYEMLIDLRHDLVRIGNDLLRQQGSKPYYKESLNEGIEDLDSISSIKAKDMRDVDFKVLKPLVDEYLKDRKALGNWPDSVDERNFVKKWYKLADKCKEIAKNGMQGITGYGRLNDFIKIKILELARSVDNTFLWYVRNNLAKFNELESLKEKLNNREKNVFINEIEKTESLAEIENIIKDIRVYDLKLYSKLVHYPNDFEKAKNYILKILKDSMLKEDYDDEIDLDYETDFDDDGVEEGTNFIEDGTEWVWVERVAGPIHLDFDNWAVWEAREFVSAGDFIIGTDEDGTNEIDIDAFEKAYYAAEKAYFVVDEDTGFIDLGPVESQTEAQDFLNGKVEDWEKDESLNESEELKEDYWYTLHYEDIGGGKEYDYEVTYDELFDCLLELAFEEDDAPEDTKEYMDWVENNFDSLYSKYKDDILDYFEEDASQKEYDEREPSGRYDPYADRGVSPSDFY